MAIIGTVLDTEIIENIDGDSPVRMIKSEVDSAEDVQSVELLSQNGVQTNPRNDAALVIVEITPTWKVAITVTDEVEPDSELGRGEQKVYALDNSNVPIARIYLRNDGRIRLENDNGSVEIKSDGTVIHNDGTDWATQFTAMKDAFDELRSDLNGMINAWNTFALAYVPGGPGGQGLPATADTASESSADMSDAKVETVQVP